MNNVDILFLHDHFINVDNTINNSYFTNGYGGIAHAYIITRNYITGVINKNNNIFPRPSQSHFDLDINIKKNSLLYTEHIYYCNDAAFVQSNSTSDNYLNNLDKYIKKIVGYEFVFTSINKLVKIIKLRSNLSDDKIKKIILFVNNIYAKK